MSILGGSASSHTCEGQHNCTASDPPVREVDEEVLVGGFLPLMVVCVLAYALIFFACCKARRRGLCRRCSKRASATAPDPIADVAPHLVEVEPPATAPVTATPAAARAIELYNSYPRVVM